MRFALDEDTIALRDAVHGVLAHETGATAWAKLGAVGAIGVLVAEEHGGLGLDENALVVLLEEIGYNGLPGPVAETIAVAAPLLAGGAPAAAARVLDGQATVTALLDEAGPPTLRPIGTRAVRISQEISGGNLYRRVARSADPAAVAEYVVLRRGQALRLYRRDELELTPGHPGDGVLLADDLRAVRDAWQRGVLGTAALLTGLSQRMLDMTVAYVRQRQQFGVPVGSFQAIKHKLADALVAVEFTRPLVLAAAWAEANHAADAVPLTSAAKARTSDTARLVAKTAIHCHGAMGYTTEYELHRFAKRAWALAASFGTAHEHRARIAREIGASDG